MKPFLFERTTGGLCKLPDEWRLLELIRHYKYQKFLSDLNEDRPHLKQISENSENKIILYSKKLLNKKITRKDFKEVFIEIKKNFFNKNSQISGSFYSSLMSTFLGPLTFHISRIAYDIDDFEEVYISYPIKVEKKKSEIYGCIKTKTCGWIAWHLLEDDKSLIKSTTKYVWLSVKDHFKKETALNELSDKRNKYRFGRAGRALSRFFVTDRLWYHEELAKLFQAFRPVEISDYSENLGFSYNAADYDE